MRRALRGGGHAGRSSRGCAGAQCGCTVPFPTKCISVVALLLNELTRQRGLDAPILATTAAGERIKVGP